jgi:hypothetical protein
LLVARSVAEAHLYLDIRGCSRADRKSRLVARGDELVTIYECTCGDQPHKFEFSIPEPEARTGLYGDEAPSSLLGPGELLAWSDRVAQTVPAQPGALSPEQRDEARRRLETAAECVLEVLKFVPPGEERVPAAAFRSEADRAMQSLEPGRFSRLRLEAVREAYRQLAQRFRV